MFTVEDDGQRKVARLDKDVHWGTFEEIYNTIINMETEGVSVVDNGEKFFSVYAPNIGSEYVMFLTKEELTMLLSYYPDVPDEI